jgi:hypothetical protein
MNPKLFLCLVLVLSGGLLISLSQLIQHQSSAGPLASSKDFTVSIVGQQQSDRRYEREGLPLVYLATSTQKQADDFRAGPTAHSSFFVVVQNTQKAADKLTMGASGWYDSLSFIVTSSSGGTYSVTPGKFAWSANPEETWIFPSGGMHVFLVDFTHSVWQDLGAWQGLPPTPSEPEIVTMTVTFRYPDSKGKMASVTSPPTDVYLCPKP